MRGRRSLERKDHVSSFVEDLARVDAPGNPRASLGHGDHIELPSAHITEAHEVAMRA